MTYFYTYLGCTPKTFGYWFYKQTKDIAMLQEILNHSTPQITLRYIGINKEEKDNVLEPV
ncbi:hypothetical protein BK767_17180 [Bacillus thuringiensis serovar kyushuensis]|nr:hypothetical protein BK767_17180 [Bacillus thuringiensis serovar kyushuensis]OTZ71988.1 hypothetical protein BK768_19480 [Bacillus thuringiensis serovar tohokuensis]